MDIEYGFAKAQTLITDMEEHPFNFANPEEEIGRKIWYNNEPASIERLILEQGCIMIKYEGVSNGFSLTKPWYEEIEPTQNLIKDDIFSSYIIWFRD